MIEINLVPEHLRKKRKKKSQAGKGFSLPKETIIGMVGGFLVLLILLHVGLQFFITTKLVHYNSLKGEMEAIRTDKKTADEVVQNLRKLRTQLKAVKDVTKEKRVLWSKKLSEISINLSRGVWLDKLELNEIGLRIKGKAVSKNSTDAYQYKFTSNLKADTGFRSAFDNIEMGTIKTRQLKSLYITDFSIKAVIKME